MQKEFCDRFLFIILKCWTLSKYTHIKIANL